MGTKKEMDLIVISPARHITDEMRVKFEIPPSAEGYTAVGVRKNHPKPGLELLQSLVGGLIERVDVYWNKHRFDGWINEEGKIHEMEPNMIGTALWFNTFMAQRKLPVWGNFNDDPLPHINRAWQELGTRDYIAGPMVIYSSMFKEALRHAPNGKTLQ